MHEEFIVLLELLREPLRDSGGIKIDDSILIVYPPESELDFRESLLDRLVPQLAARQLKFRLLDLSGFLFS